MAGAERQEAVDERIDRADDRSYEAFLEATEQPGDGGYGYEDER